jgi:hypothetical protein
MRELGWRPRWSNVDTLVQSYDWFVAQREGDVPADDRSTHRKPVRQGLIWVLKRLS